MKLANWNVERASTKARRLALRTATDAVAADVWVLTETRDTFHPGLPYSCSSAGWRDALPGLDEEADRWVTIWSKYPLEKLDVRDTVRTTAARIHPPEEKSFIVFGTVLPWMTDKWRGYPSTDGAAFQAALKVQQWDWQVLRKRFPEDEFFVIGAFNQDLSKAQYCGSKANKDALRAALDLVGLVALTGGDGDPIRRDSPSCACIDHICALKESRWKAEQAVRWPEEARPDPNLSDHFGVAVQFKLRV